MIYDLLIGNVNRRKEQPKNGKFQNKMKGSGGFIILISDLKGNGQSMSFT